MMKSTPVDVLERADVAALTADDAALHVVGRQLDEARRRLRGMGRRDPLQRVAHERARTPLRLGLRLLLGHAHHARQLVAHEFLRALQHLALRVLDRQAADPRQLGELRFVRARQLGLEELRVRLAVGERLLLAGQIVEATDGFLLLGDRTLLRLDRGGAELVQLRLRVGAGLQRLLTRLDLSLAADRLGGMGRLGDVPCDLGLGPVRLRPIAYREPTSAPIRIPAATPIRVPIVTSMSCSYVRPVGTAKSETRRAAPSSSGSENESP